MNQILQWLSGGDLRSDGMANEAAEFVLTNPQVFEDLFEGLSAPDDVIRGRSADALEKVAREKPDLLIEHMAELIHFAKSDPVPMVKMHLAMTLGHLVACDIDLSAITQTLIHLLDDESAFTKSWAIASLCILARKHPDGNSLIVAEIGRHQADQSIAIRTRVRKALHLLLNPEAPFPKGWIKSKHLQGI